LRLWLRQKQWFGSAKVYAGHGGDGPTSIVDEQADYINAIRDMVVAALKEEPELSEAGKAAVQQQVRVAYKNWPLEMIIDMNITSLAGEARS
jgi:hypothetical protein